MKKQDQWRLYTLGLVVVLTFAILTGRLYTLQIRPPQDESVDYSAIAQSTMTKTLYEHGMRGQIQDVNGTILAYDKKIYNVEFYRDPSSKGDQNEEYSRSIWNVIQLIREAEGKEIKFNFWLKRDVHGQWAFVTGTTDIDPEVAESRERMFRSNFYVNTTPLEELYEKLCENYRIHEIDKDFPEHEKLTEEDKLQVLGVWQEMQMNAFNSTPIKLVSDVQWSTMMEVETRRSQLSGISISVENQRVYPNGTMACHILGYTGLMQSQAQIDEYTAKGYQRTDTIGMDGIERSMEQWLTGNSARRRGETVVEIDRNGRRIRELSHTAPTDGNTVKLTIDSELQKVTEKALHDIVNLIRDTQEKRITKAEWLQENKEELQKYAANGRQLRMAQNGAIVVLDMQARVLAMASFPDYDPNLFVVGMTIEERKRMFDERNPLYNNAIKAADTPGSVFKMATALAGLANGVIGPTETIDDGGPFTLYDTVNPPKCWINNPKRHPAQDVSKAIANSCNYYFYTVASRLGENGERLYRYAAKLGLTSKTNIDLPNEKKSVVGSQVSLYDPSKPITGYDQDTWLPVQVRDQLKKHLFQSGERHGFTYTDVRLDRCVKALMDMAFDTKQGAEQMTWIREIRSILIQELNMTEEMVYRADIVGDIVLALNEIKWGGSQTTMVAIGQSITLTTPIAMARYVAAVVNGGYVYDVQIIDSIISPEGEIISSFDEPVLVNDLSGEIGQYIDYIKLGMQGVTADETGTARGYFTGWDYEQEIGGKTGTAEKSKIDVESNSWFVAFAPYEEPEIAIVIYVPYGLSGAMSSQASKPIIEHYMQAKETDDNVILPLQNGFAQ